MKNVEHDKSIEKSEQIEKDGDIDMACGETNGFLTMSLKEAKKTQWYYQKSGIEAADIYVSCLYNSEDINHIFLFNHCCSFYPKDSKSFHLSFRS